MAPPIANTMAPLKRVPLRPIISPMRPAARDVTGEGVNVLRLAKENGGLTECANFKDCNHCAYLDSIWVVEILEKVRAGDDTRHDPRRRILSLNCSTEIRTHTHTLDHIRTVEGVK